MGPILGEPLAPSSRAGGQAGGQACCLTQQSPRRQMAWAGFGVGLAAGYFNSVPSPSEAIGTTKSTCRRELSTP